MAGPCAVESEEQILSTARYLKEKGVKFLRGGAYKPRTSPYSFQGLEEEGFRILSKAREETGLLIVSEAVSSKSLELAAKYVDIIQIGARNMQNFSLLQVVGRMKLPVMLKRGLSATIEEWLNAAEYIMNEGNYNIILCERGIRTFETYTRNTMDLSSIPAVKELSHLPVIADPSHGTGRWKLVTPMSRAAIAAGADGIIVEVHPCPKAALSDGPQSLNFETFSELMDDIRKIAVILGREM
jgi:3-deoxy-7-phosphoheptulonate synthase